MSNPARAISKQWKRSTKDVSDEWKRLPEDVRTVVTVQAAVAATLLTAGAVAGPAAAAGTAGAGAAGAGAAGAGAGAAAIGGTGIGVGTGTLAATGTAGTAVAGGGGFLGTLGAGASTVGTGLKAAGGWLAANPTAALIGGQALAGATAPEPERQVDVLREQERIRQGRQPAAPVSGGGFLSAGPQPSGAYTTPQPLREPIQMGQNYANAQVQMPAQPAAVGRWSPETNRWEAGA